MNTIAIIQEVIALLVKYGPEEVALIEEIIAAFSKHKAATQQVVSK